MRSGDRAAIFCEGDVLHWFAIVPVCMRGSCVRVQHVCACVVHVYVCWCTASCVYIPPHVCVYRFKWEGFSSRFSNFACQVFCSTLLYVLLGLTLLFFVVYLRFSCEGKVYPAGKCYELRFTFGHQWTFETCLCDVRGLACCIQINMGTSILLNTVVVQ